MVSLISRLIWCILQTRLSLAYACLAFEIRETISLSVPEYSKLSNHLISFPFTLKGWYSFKVSRRIATVLDTFKFSQTLADSMTKLPSFSRMSECRCAKRAISSAKSRSSNLYPKIFHLNTFAPLTDRAFS